MDDCLSTLLLHAASVRVADVLKPHLGELEALRHADRIAQALVDGCGDPETVARGVLARLSDTKRHLLACRVAAVWLEVSRTCSRHRAVGRL